MKNRAGGGGEGGEETNDKPFHALIRTVFWNKRGKRMEKLVEQVIAETKSTLVPI